MKKDYNNDAEEACEICDDIFAIKRENGLILCATHKEFQSCSGCGKDHDVWECTKGFNTQSKERVYEE